MYSNGRFVEPERHSAIVSARKLPLRKRVRKTYVPDCRKQDLETVFLTEKKTGQNFWGRRSKSFLVSRSQKLPPLDL